MDSGVSKFGNEKVFCNLYTMLGLVELPPGDMGVPGTGTWDRSSPKDDETNPGSSWAALQTQGELG